MAKSRRDRRSAARQRGEAPDGREPADSAAALPEDAPTPPAAERSPLDRWFVPIAVGILLVAAALRLPELALNPFHHDEGVNGYFTTNLMRQGTYTYDPANYHGPSLYYFALVSATLFGLTDEAVRFVPVLAGLATVALVFPLRRFIGPIATLTGAALIAVSPGAVYISRYFIHESLLVCFSLGLVVSALLYLDQRRPQYLLTGAAFAALMFTTKESGIITVAVLAIAGFVAAYYVRRRTPAAARRARVGGKARRTETLFVDGVEYRAVGSGASKLAVPGLALEHVIAAAVVFLAIYVLLFSSFFTNFPKGLVDSLATFTVWTQTGAETQVQPPQQYLVWLVRAEAPIFILGTIGGLIAAIEGRNRVWVFIGLWALGITVAYSIIKYKTPWIALNMVVPLALLAGLTIDRLARSGRWRAAAPVALAAAVAVAGYQAIDLSYRHYDDETYPYVYVHTTRETFDLLDRIDGVAAEAGTGRDTGVVFVTPDYWPLPWYLRDYPKAGFFGKVVPTEEPMIVANVNQEAELGQYADRYKRVGVYTLRPGVELALYVRNELATP